MSDSAEISNSHWLANTLASLDTSAPILWLLLAMSVQAMTIVLFKLMQFQSAQLGRRQLAEQALQHWKNSDSQAALDLAETTSNPTVQTLARAIRGQLSQLPAAEVREEVLRYGTHALFQLRRGLRPLEVIASLAPLIGLLGTVLGMIDAFQQLENAGSQVDPGLLSSGIWQALLTTAAGLIVAIPAVAAHHWLERRVDHLAHEMDNLVTQIFTTDLSAPIEHA